MLGFQRSESETHSETTSGEGVAASTWLCGKLADPTFPLLLPAGGGSTVGDTELAPRVQAARRARGPGRGGKHPFSTAQPGWDFPLFVRTAGLAHQKKSAFRRNFVTFKQAQTTKYQLGE